MGVLSNKDIERIEKLGFNKSFFVKKHKGWFQLKNKDGRCVFHNGKNCSVYPYRPEGCRLYPIIYDEEKNCATLDEDCPHGNEFRISEIELTKLRSLIIRLTDERRQRR